MTLKAVTNPSPLEELLDILARLRHPVHGSPWERDQTHTSISPNVLEEAYEVVDAIQNEDMRELKGELGDLLLQVVFQSQIAKEGGHFTFNEVAQGIIDKVKARLPHFFAGREVSVDKQLEDWEKIKQMERDRKGHTSVLDGIAKALPALARTQKIHSRVNRVGFKWHDLAGVMGKVDEELAEVKQAIATSDKAHISEEIGDLLFSTAILSDWLGIDAEQALRRASKKFEERFRFVEQRVKENGKSLEQSTLAEMQAFWKKAKQSE
jgi:nucleoside triphosphate diphosphatase